LRDMRLSLYEFRTGAETGAGQRVVYDVANDRAYFGAAEVEGRALVWQLEDTVADAEGALLSRRIEVDPYADWVLRCDRVDFPLGGVAYTHIHPGPGIRYMLHGSLDVHTEGHSASYGPGAAWFEAGPDPVFAQAGDKPTRFVRVMILPRALIGKSSIQYVNEEDKAKPKPQQYRVFVDAPLNWN